MIAVCQIRQEPHYRREAFVNGLRKAGYSIATSGRPANAQDLLVIWNRYGAYAGMADTWERNKGTVLVCENGYVGKDLEGRQLYAISAKGHNGSGWFPIGTENRWTLLGMDLHAWKTDDNGHILVCGQRGIGTPTMASPHNWHLAVADRIKKQTTLPIKIRPHPGNQPAKTKLDDDLKGASACVIWSSSSGVKALIEGYPVYFDAPHWICEQAAVKVIHVGTVKSRDDSLRLSALQYMAHAQWTVKEIESGEPFVRFRDKLLTEEVTP